MPIEVRQMVVTSSVVQAREGGDPDPRQLRARDDELTREILDACRRMVRSERDRRKER